MNFESLIVIIKHVSEVLSTQMARQMHFIQMLAELTGVEEEFLAEIAPGMGQNFGTLFICRVTVLDMGSQLLQVVDSLLANKHCATLKADQTEGLLMRGLHMTP